MDEAHWAWALARHNARVIKWAVGAPAVLALAVVGWVAVLVLFGGGRNSTFNIALFLVVEADDFERFFELLLLYLVGWLRWLLTRELLDWEFVATKLQNVKKLYLVALQNNNIVLGLENLAGFVQKLKLSLLKWRERAKLQILAYQFFSRLTIRMWG